MKRKKDPKNDFTLAHSSTGNWLTAWPIHRPSHGQASLEMAAALVVVLILLVASVRLFAWLNAGMVYRQADYERTRVEAGSKPLVAVNLSSQTSTRGVEVNESAYPRLNIFE